MQSFQLMSKRPSSPLDNAIPTINVDQIQPLINFWRTVQTAGFSEHEVRTHMSQLFMDIIMNFSDQILSGVGKIIAREQLSSSDAVLSEDAVKDALSAVLRTSFKTSSADEYYALEKAHEQISAEVTDTVNSVLSRVGSPGSKLTVDKEQGYTPSRYKLLSIVSNAQKFMQCCWPCRTKISGEEKPVDKELQERAKRLKVRNELRRNGLGVAESVETANLSQNGASGISSFVPEIKPRSDSATSETQETQVESLPTETEQETTKQTTHSSSESFGDKEHITNEILSENKQQKAMKAAAQQEKRKRVTQSSVNTWCSCQAYSEESSQSSSEEDSNMKELLDEAAVTVARSSSLNKDEAEVLVSRLSDKSEADAVSIYSMMLDEMDEIRYRNSLDSDERKVSTDIETMEEEAACHLEKLMSVPDDIQEASFYEKLSQDISNGQHKDVNEALQQVIVQNMSPRNSIGAWKFGRKVTRSVLEFLKSVKEWVDKQRDQEPKTGEVRNTYQKLRNAVLCMSMDPQTHYTGTRHTPPQPTTAADVHFEWDTYHIRFLAYEVTRHALQTKSLANVAPFVKLWQRLEENMTQWNVKVRPDAENILDVAEDVYKDLCSGSKKHWVSFNCLIDENYIDTIIDTIRYNLEIPQKKSRISSFFQSVMFPLHARVILRHKAVYEYAPKTC
uniref:Uncharacterized protein n=1 Tax=Knipowitschia caucasica TaxID=637954 RepID=A0AAV2J3W8_KNICA